MQPSFTLDSITGEAGRLCLLLSTFLLIEISEKIMLVYCSLISRKLRKTIFFLDYSLFKVDCVATARILPFIQS